MHVDLSNLRPMDDRVLVRKLRIRESIIDIPEAYRDEPHYGEVVAVGPGRFGKHGHRIPCEVQVGQKVRWQSQDLEFGDLVLIMEGDILGIVPDA